MVANIGYKSYLQSGSSSVVEHLVANERVASSNLVSRSIYLNPLAVGSMELALWARAIGDYCSRFEARQREVVIPFLLQEDRIST